MPLLSPLLTAALDRRASLCGALQAEGTDCFRLFHGATEGRPGLAVDRYGPLLLVQTWQQPLSAIELDDVRDAVNAVTPGLHLAWNHRARGSCFADHHQPQPQALTEFAAHEQGRVHLLRARHRGRDPWFYLDFRVARRWIFQHTCSLVEGTGQADVLNLFAYTGTAGIAAATAGAKVLNIDFAASALEIARRNAQANDIPADRFELLQADVLPTLRQLGGLAVKGRGARRRAFLRMEPHRFDIVVLDPPTWATSAFGAVDIVRDYAALFKPAVLATSAGGRILATNHASSVDLDDWLDQLQRCAAKVGRPLVDLTVLVPEADFPSPDGHPPLKIVVATVS